MWGWVLLANSQRKEGVYSRTLLEEFIEGVYFTAFVLWSFHAKSSRNIKVSKACHNSQFNKLKCLGLLYVPGAYLLLTTANDVFFWQCLIDTCQAHATVDIIVGTGTYQVLRVFILRC